MRRPTNASPVKRVLLTLAAIGTFAMISIHWTTTPVVHDHHYHIAAHQSLTSPHIADTKSANAVQQPISISPHLSTSSRTDVPEGAVPNASCVAGRIIDFPLTGLEMELKRLAALTISAMQDVGAVYWPTDGTLLGLMRNGRVSTDRDLDYQIHATYDTCHGLLASLKKHFEKRARIKSFKVVNVKHNGRRIGRYAMVRLFREHGTFDTGPDFNCVYMDDPAKPMYFTHRKVLTPVPSAVYPLGWCLLYGHTVPCPKNGMALLESLKPRYEGCMVFPHCLGPPEHSSRSCMSPHPEFPLQKFVDSTFVLAECGFTSLRDHFHEEASCAQVLKGMGRRCETIQGSTICFLQKFDG